MPGCEGLTLDLDTLSGPRSTDASPMRLGERIELTGVTVEITAVTADGRPAEATFRFASSLDDKSLIWLEWRKGSTRRSPCPPSARR